MSKETTKRIWIADRIIHYQDRDFRWALPIDSIEVFGEYTDPNGPFVDDYFFVFVYRPEHRWNEASFYAAERDEFLNDFAEILEAKLTCGLVSSTDYNSRVIWPPELEGSKLFEFVPVESNGVWQRLKHRVIPEYYFAFTDAVGGFLQALEKQPIA
jgi:hypothetical protein